MNGKRIDIQWLRAIAATEVVVCHSDLVTKHFSQFELAKAPWYAPLAGIGVELFFIVSGYIICMRALSYTTGGAFILSRIYRLFPMYALFTSLVLLTFFVNPRWRLNNFELNLDTIISSYLILPQWSFPVLGVGWTLEHEMVFYYTVAMAVAVAPLNGARRMSVGWVLAGLGFLGCLQGPPPGLSLWLHHIFSPYMFAFAFGWMLRCEEETAPLVRWGNIALLAALAICGLFLGGPFSDELLLRIVLMAGLFLAFSHGRRFFQGEGSLSRIGVLLGDASFSIYLSHWFVLSVFGKLLGILQPPAIMAEPLRAAGVVASVVVGVWIYKLVERPIDLWLRGTGSIATTPRPSF